MSAPAGVAAQTGLDSVEFIDSSNLLPGYVPDSIPFPFGTEGIGGVGWFDYENDGDLDLFVPNGKGAPNALYRNNGDGTFTDVAAAAGVDSATGYSGIAIGDLDNDGHDDILLSGEGLFVLGSQSPVALYHNQRDGTFMEVSRETGVVGSDTALASVLADFDNDGDLDIFITAPGHIAFLNRFGVPGIPPAFADRNVLYRNDGGMKFTEIGAAAGVDGDEGACVALATDYDDDGDQDLIVGNCSAFDATGTFPRPTPMNLYRNDGNLTFTDVAAGSGLDRLGFWMSIAPGDYDNDGDIDLFATSTGGFPPPSPVPHGFFRNNGDGTYTDIAVPLGLGLFEFSWGASMLDVDHDGYLDLFFVGSLPAFRVFGPPFGHPGRLFVNDQAGGFDQVVFPDTGFNFVFSSSSGVAQADFDLDGDQDLVVNTRSVVNRDPVTGEITVSALGQPVLLENVSETANSIQLRLVSADGTPVVGARVRLKARGVEQVREIHAGSSAASTESPWPHFGIGRANDVDLRIAWPSGLVEEFDDLPTGGLVTLLEGTGRADVD